ncbi:MAG: uncharacterized protein K0S91_2097 [Nitrososphaeraceae archaeon]|nr:uncharacterized protein [Nitrososphaeraceae archaeon]
MKIFLPKIPIGTKQNKYFLNHIEYLYCMVSLLEYLPIITSGLEARVRLESTESFARMAKESPYYAERFALVESPDQFYTLRAYIDLYEFIFRLHKTDAIDEQLWLRWASGARAMKSIPKFQAVWNKTKNVHTRDFVNFIDSL